MSEMLTVAIMAFNEEASLESVVREIGDVLQKEDQPYELLVIDDGSEDSTGAIAEELSRKDSRVRVIRHEPNQGLGAVYRSGFDGAQGELLTFMPADGQIPAADLVGFLQGIREADMVLGYIPNRPVPFYVKALSAGERLLYKVLFGAMPKFQGIVMFRTSILKDVTLVSQGRGWTILMELILRTARAGYRMGRAPTGLRERVAGESKVNNLKNIWSNFRQTVALVKHL